MSALLELVCPAGSPAMMKAAVEAGADAIYCGLRDETNARNFPGLNFSPAEMQEGASWCRARGVKLFAAINTFARAGEIGPWVKAVDIAIDAGADALILADIGLLEHVRRAYPGVRVHLSVQAGAGTPEAIGFYAREFGVKRVVLPRVLSVADIAAIAAAVDVELEVFAFGGLCVMAEGRCALSSYVTGQSPNLAGVCSPAESVTYERQDDMLAARLNGVTIDRFHADESAGYPTICKARLVCEGKALYPFEEPASLDASDLLPALARAGVRAVKVEGRQRGRAYIARVAGGLRRAIDMLGESEEVVPLSLASLTEGGRKTTGAYKKQWR
jgi:putative protease